MINIIIPQVSIAYCSGRARKACQLLEGTRLPAQCPCVDGGQWIYRGKQKSYCEVGTVEADISVLTH